MGLYAGSKPVVGVYAGATPVLDVYAGPDHVWPEIPLDNVFVATFSGAQATLWLGNVGAGTIIDWGDGETFTFPAGTGPNRDRFSHDYATPGDYAVIITGTFRWIGSPSQSAAQMSTLREVTYWGADTGTTSTYFAFYRASGLVSVVQPPLAVQSMYAMFSGATTFNDQSLSGWDVSNVTNMGSMFLGASSFNADLSGWDVSNVANHSSFGTGSALTPEHLPVWV